MSEWLDRFHTLQGDVSKPKERLELYLYSFGPIDAWSGWIPEDAYRLQLVYDCDGEDDPGPYLAFRRRALEVARSHGWDGDISKGPYVAALPVDDNSGWCPIMMAWKQANNGTCFIASPRPLPLPWLGEPRWSGNCADKYRAHCGAGG